MASDNIFNRMYLTTNNVLYEIDKESRMQDLVNLYKQRLSNRLVNTSQSCMIYDAACLGLTRDADHNQIVHGFIEYAIICHQNVIPDNVGPGSVLGGVLGEIGPEYPRALDLKTQKYNVLFLNPFWNPYDQGPFPLADLIHDSDPRADLMGKPNQINKKTGGAARLGGWGYINIMNNKWGGSRPFLRKAVINSSIRPIVISQEKMQQVQEALKTGKTKASICRNFSIKRSTLYDALNRITSRNNLNQDHSPDSVQ